MRAKSSPEVANPWSQSTDKPWHKMESAATDKQLVKLGQSQNDLVP